jgi:DNA-binding response OmpR family regulator
MAVVALIEDDERIRQALERELRAGGHHVRSSATGLAGLRQIVDDPPDVVILDLGLPDIDGLELLKMIRAVSQVPVITVEQLDARIRAVLRRIESSPADTATTVGALQVDPVSRVAVLDDQPLDLNRKEFDLLHYLAVRAGQVVSKRQLLADVWNQPYGGDDKTVDTHLSWLRRKLGESARQPRYLVTVRGVGVKLVAPER